MLSRKLEPEVMDTPEEAGDYDAMDHSEVNRIFVADLLEATDDLNGDILDLGTGTAQIPIELCQHNDDCRIMAVDAAIAMLELARLNIEVAGLTGRIQLDKADAKDLPYDDDSFTGVISNSIIHHLPEPIEALRQSLRVVQSGGLLFFRDLLRPASQAELDQLVATYTGSENDHAQAMFRDSLHAALTLDEIRSLAVELNLPSESVQATSDRHWTLCARKPS